VAKRSLVTHGAEFLRHVVPEVIRPLRSLWNEVIGFLFISLAFLLGLAVFRKARSFDGSLGVLLGLIGTGLFVLVLFGFGVSSFLRARKISRS
jgi:hypothetical protein